MTVLKKLQTSAGIPLEKDDLCGAEIRDLYRQINEIKSALSLKNAQLVALRKQNSASNGLEPAYIDSDDLVAIIEDLLSATSPVSKAFRRREVSGGKCAQWAKRTIRYPPHESALSFAIEELIRGGKNLKLQRMDAYGLLDIRSILKSDSYSEALNKIKRQSRFAQLLEDKDAQLAIKNTTIEDQKIEMKRLEEELVKNRSGDWRQRAISLKMSGCATVGIARQLGKSRSTISTFLNTPDAKLQISMGPGLL